MSFFTILLVSLFLPEFASSSQHEFKQVVVSSDAELIAAISNLEEGTHIVLEPGTYESSVRIINQSNIIISGKDPKNTFLNPSRSAPKVQLIRADRPICFEQPQLDVCQWVAHCNCPWIPIYPGNDHSRATVQITDSQSISIRGLQLRNSWPAHISISNSHDIKIDDIHAVSGTYAIHAEGETTKGITVTNSTWSQNHSGVQEMWRDMSWAHLHHGTLYYYNGAFFGSRNILGDVEIRDNRINDAFNAIRMVVKQSECSSPDCVLKMNKDVRILDNHFKHIRDNAVEPEHIVNGHWQVSGNSFHCHADISLDSVHNPDQKAQLLIEDNIFLKDEQPGYRVRAPLGTELNNGGKILKLPKKAFEIPTADARGTIKDIPFLNIVFRGNIVDAYHEVTAHNVTFLKGVIPRGTDLTSWNNNHLNVCKIKFKGEAPMSKDELCEQLEFQSVQ